MLWIGGDPGLAVPAGSVDRVQSVPEAVRRFEVNHYDLVVLDCGDALLETSGEDATGSEGPTRTGALADLPGMFAGIPLVVWGVGITASAAVRWTRWGAYDVAGTEDDLARVVEGAVRLGSSRRTLVGSSLVGSSLVGSSKEPEWRRALVGDSRAMRETVETIRLVAPRRSTVLITGETGTGKELLARAVHLASPRAQAPLITVNAAALPEHLLEAELFGHVKGAFTGAIQGRVGRFEQAHRSTLFLDEIGDLPLEVQTKLLRFLQEREFERVGSSETLRVDVRLIAATNVDLLERVKQRRFREDLYYRLNVVPLETPPLRERLEDIPALTGHFIEKICRQEGIPPRQVAPATLIHLRGYSWPGNVRQLENAVERAVALSGERTFLMPYDFPVAAAGPRPLPAASISRGIAVPDAGLDFDQTVGGIERQILEEALRKTGGNKTAAAGMLGLKRTTLSAKLRSLGATAAG